MWPYLAILVTVIDTHLHILGTTTILGKYVLMTGVESSSVYWRQKMWESDEYYYNLLEQIDDRDGLEEWEIEFIYEIFLYPNILLTNAQKLIINKMKDKYL